MLELVAQKQREREEREEREALERERQRVREKIERDKAERAKKYGGGVGSQPPATEPGPVPSSPSQEPPTKREYDQCRIQDSCLLLSSLWPRNVPAERGLGLCHVVSYDN
uniref:UBX domain protein 1 n=1 Tax=Equus asinus asinus TaxID=83772 RepID=A0A8C4M1Q6_EQUAS